MTEPILSVRGVSKTYASGVHALHAVDLDINKGEIFALLGPNGAGKTTLISIICGIVTPSTGTITVGGFDAIRQPKRARHFEAIDCEDAVQVHFAPSFTRSTKMSSRLDLEVSRSLNPILRSASLRSSEGMPVRSAWASNT